MVNIIRIDEFVRKAPAELKLGVLAGLSGLSKRSLSSSRVQKLGLALADFTQFIHQGRLQVIGQSEIAFLGQLTMERRIEAIHKQNLDGISCILVTKSLKPPEELLQIADEIGLPILQTTVGSADAIRLIVAFLDYELAPQATIHGVCLGIHNFGVLLLGESGIGKSECALDLIIRGHRLIADDSVVIKRIGDILEAKSPDLIEEHLEIRGLGIINVKELYGLSSVGKQMNIDLCIEFRNWNDFEEIDRLGLMTNAENILGVKITKFILPVNPGRNLATLVETTIRLFMLKANGIDAASRLITKHREILQSS